MRFEQTHEILEHIRDFHSSLSGCYHHLENEAVRERTRLLLDYLVKRENDLARALEDFTNEADPELLDTWFQFADESELLKFKCPVINPDTDLEMDNILQLAQEAHDCLMSTFAEIISNCESQRISTVFEKLRDQAEQQWRTFIRDTNLLSDF